MLRRDRSDAAGIPAEMVRPDLPLLRTIGSRCIALQGTVGACVSCKIYEARPQACRNFQPGSPLCLEARQAQLKGEIKPWPTTQV